MEDWKIGGAGRRRSWQRLVSDIQFHRKKPAPRNMEEMPMSHPQSIVGFLILYSSTLFSAADVWIFSFIKIICNVKLITTTRTIIFRNWKHRPDLIINKYVRCITAVSKVGDTKSFGSTIKTKYDLGVRKFVNFCLGMGIKETVNFSYGFFLSFFHLLIFLFRVFAFYRRRINGLPSRLVIKPRPISRLSCLYNTRGVCQQMALARRKKIARSWAGGLDIMREKTDETWLKSQCSVKRRTCVRA